MTWPKRIRLESPDKVIEEGVSEIDEGWQLIGSLPETSANDGGIPIDSADEEEEEEEDTENRNSTGASVIRRGSYAISQVGRSKMKTLHRVGESHRIPGVHYNKYEVIGGEPPNADKLHRSCKICFPGGDLPEPGIGSEASSSSDSSTSVEGSDSDRN